MPKKTDWWVLAVVALLAVGLAYSQGLFSLVAQEREIGRVTGLGAGDYTCPATYNGLQVDRCQGFRYRVGFQLWEQSYFKGYVFSRTLCQEYKTQGYKSEYTCREDITCATPSGASCYSMGQYGVSSDSTFPLGFSPGETASFSTGSGDITYYESLIQCPSGDYAFRSQCPKPITCSDGSTVYAPNVCKISTPAPPPADTGSWLTNNVIYQFFANFIKQILSAIPPLYSIAGQTTVAPNTQASYQVNIATPYPISTSTYQAGFVQTRQGTWALINSNNNIVQQGSYDFVTNNYVKNITITTPANINNYVLFAAIKEWNQTYSAASNTWTTSNGAIIAYEGVNIATRATIAPQPPVDVGGWISSTLSGLISWLSGLFSGFRMP